MKRRTQVDFVKFSWMNKTIAMFSTREIQNCVSEIKYNKCGFEKKYNKCGLQETQELISLSKAPVQNSVLCIFVKEILMNRIVFKDRTS